MDSQALATLLSSLTSTIISLLLILLSSFPHTTPFPVSLFHLLSDSDSAMASLTLLPHKRKRTHFPISPHPLKPGPNSAQLGHDSVQLGQPKKVNRVKSFNPFSDQTHFPISPNSPKPGPNSPKLGQVSPQLGQKDRVNSFNPFSDPTHFPISPHSPKPGPNSPKLGQPGRVNSFSNRTQFPNGVKFGYEQFNIDGLFGYGRVDSFKHCFNMTRGTFEWLAGLLEPLLDCRDPGCVPLGLSAEVRLGIGLFRVATGAGFAEIANRFGVEEKVARFCVKQLCRVLCTNFRFWVGFRENENVKCSGIPNCCGVVSTTVFELSGNDKSRGKSVKTQIVVDSSCRILSVFAGFGGDKSDFTVLKCSALYKDIKERRVLDGSCVRLRNVVVPRFLIGNGDYPLLPWLITPFVDPLRGSCEDEFNSELQCINGSSIRVIASLRNWGILSKPIEGEIKDAVAYIGACSILHNGLLTREDYSALSDEVEDLEGVKGRSLRESSDGDEGEVVRMALAMRDKGVS